MKDVPDCTSAHHCEMNGQCMNLKCECSQGWTGTFCQTLLLQPAKRGAGYHRTNYTSWGGAIIPPEVSGLEKYQLVVAEFDLHCGFNAWYVCVLHPLRFFKHEDAAGIVIALVSTLATPSSIPSSDAFYADMRIFNGIPR